MELTPKKIYEDFRLKNIDKNSAAELLTSLIENTEDDDIRLKAIEFMYKIGIQNEKIFNLLENLLISDLNGNIRCAATNYLKKFFLEKSLPLLKWAIQYESDYNCMIVLIQTLVELNNAESKLLLVDMIKRIKNTKYLDDDKRIENKKFKKIVKKLLKEIKGENLAHQTLAEIIINYLTISNLTKKFYSVYFELDNALVRKLDLADVEYEVRGWKSDFKNNIKELNEITGIEFLKSLTHLNLSNNQISNIEELFKLKNLTHLYISNNKIKDIENLEYIKELPNLKYVDISGNPILEHLNSHYFNTNRFGNIKIVLKKYKF